MSVSTIPSDALSKAAKATRWTAPEELAFYLFKSAIKDFKNIDTAELNSNSKPTETPPQKPESNISVEK